MSETVFCHPGWSLRPVAGRIGAEISGLRLSCDLPEETVAALRRALNHHKVLFFRGQSHLDDVEQEAFGRLFGEIVSHPTIPPCAGTAATLAALDAQTRETLQDELLRIWEKTGKTILFITHAIDEAVYLGQRVAVMTARPGRILDIVDIPLGSRAPRRRSALGPRIRPSASRNLDLAARAGQRVTAALTQDPHPCHS
jgi:hypothetical protein